MGRLSVKFFLRVCSTSSHNYVHHLHGITIRMATQQSEEAAFESPDGFALRIKYRKITLCVPVDPRTTYEELAKLSLELLAKTESDVPTETGVETFEDLTENDLAFFQGDSVAGGNGLTSDEIQFVEINRTKQSTIGQMGLKDGANAILYIGFRNKSKKSYLQPDVSIPSINDDEAEETDQMIEEGKGKSRA